MDKTLTIATHNPGKRKELMDLLRPFQFVINPDLSIPPVAETGLTFVENAILKARHAAKWAGTCALSDDSGLVVPFLKGEPGVYSSRYAGEKAKDKDNIHKLLTALGAVDSAKRKAYFYCCMVYLTQENDPTPIIAEGKWWGEIARAPRGTEGFGYDPIFFIPDLNQTAAQLPLSLKNQISHRAIALKALINQLRLFSDECLNRS